VSRIIVIWWADYLESHAQRIYSPVLQTEINGAKRILKGIDESVLPTTFTARDVYRNQWSGLQNVSLVKPALDVLVQYNYLSETPQGKGGSKTTIYNVNVSYKKPVHTTETN